MKNPAKTKKQCLGNFCQKENPNCEKCGIDEAMDILEDFIRARENCRKLQIKYAKEN